MYEQKICYIDLYRNGVKCGNMGHVRMEWDEERYRFGASLCHMDRQTIVTAVLERAGGRPRTTIRNIAIIHGKGSVQLDWMPLEGTEERLLFQASGETYGICRLPKMRETEKREAEEGAKQSVSALFGSAPEAAPQTPETKLSIAEDQSRTSKESSRTTEGQNGMPAAVARAIEKKNAAAEAPPQEPEKKNAAAEAPQEPGKRNAAAEAAPQEPEKRNAAAEAAPQSPERQSAVWEMGQKNAVRGSSQESARRGAVQETVVLACPQDAEERRRRERHVTNLSDDKWKQLCSIYPTAHPIGDDVEFIKITPADFVVLRQEYQNLVRNSFLLHGYYNYEHILLGKYPDKYYIGVPGIMHEQERIAAAMFGFVGFERAEAPKEQKENRDRFGYYMMEVGI